MNLKKDRIITLIGEAQYSLGQLFRYKDDDSEILAKDPEKIGNIKYQLIVLIEACIDLCTHIVAKSFSVAPESYSHCFQLIQENNIIEKQLADKLSEMAKFRNLLVHLYWKVDNKRVIEIAQNELGTFKEFIQLIGRMVNVSKKNAL